jgi:hypothetical protein
LVRGSFAPKVSAEPYHSIDGSLKRLKRDTDPHDTCNFRPPCSHDWTLLKLKRLGVNISSPSELIRLDYFCMISQDEITIPQLFSYES